jgi:fumarate reductase (CoM/CoB) subunit A
MVDGDAQSSLPGLFVAGEIAGGVRGPDRPGGNSLAEGQVFGHRAGVAAARLKSGQVGSSAASLEATLEDFATLARRNAGLNVLREADALRQAMQRHCMIEKTGDGLSGVLTQARSITQALRQGGGGEKTTLVEALTLKNMAQSAEIVLRACLNRCESRSGHYRLDHPERDDIHFRAAFIVKRAADGPELTRHVYPTTGNKQIGGAA